MENNNYWEAFETTGKISDYLSFKSNFQEEASNFGDNRNDRTDNKGTEGFRI